MSISSVAASLLLSFLASSFCIAVEPQAEPAAQTRIGDPYPLTTCPVTGKALGKMGAPVVKIYSGREVRFCCDGCPSKFENKLETSMAALDAKIAADQSPLYPTQKSIVSGKDLGANPVEFVHGNRLIRIAEESERATFLADTAKYLALLDKDVIASQGADYPLTKCPISDDPLGGAMGAPVDFVIAGRLIRLCCGSCVEAVLAEPAKFVLQIDEARKDKAAAAAEGAKR